MEVSFPLYLPAQTPDSRLLANLNEQAQPGFDRCPLGVGVAAPHGLPH
jgi:hypothetical protein